MTTHVEAEPTFAGALSAVAGIPGWLSADQARALYERAQLLPAGAQIVEIGSYHGRSTIVLALGAREDVSVVAIDSHDGNNRGPREVRGERELGQADFETFHENLHRSEVAGRVRHVRARSQEALDEVAEPIDLLYIDGAHQYRAARDDIRAWGERVRPGGTMFIHDGFSSVGVTLALLRELAWDGGWQYIGRTRSLVEYRRLATNRRTNLAQHASSLPWFTRNVAVKLALVSRQPWALRLLRHNGEQWPY